MDKMKVGTGEWVVVCDGRKALILENIGDSMFPNLHTKEVHEHVNERTAAQGTDAPGSVQQSTGHARSSVEQTDWHDLAERAFLKQLADRLHHAVQAGETKGLTMVASPRALGMIRADYSDAVRKVLHGEIHKDLVKLPVYEIEKQLLN
ncbi:host attachment protein [Bradyrhizobium sp. HKCCYLS2038]|uniref:host attachment protein n=1 Tax=unclassified Bradyrhizobium TaxID=2631580 RepID=UPI003EBA89BE